MAKLQLSEIIDSIKEVYPFDIEDVIRDDRDSFFNPNIQLSFNSTGYTFLLIHHWRRRRNQLIVFKNQRYRYTKDEIYTIFYTSCFFKSKKQLKEFLKVELEK